MTTTSIDDSTRSAIARMIGFARVGQLGSARQAGKDSLASVSEPAPIHALLGRMACEAGDFDDGIAHLAAAIDRLPGEPAVAMDLTAAYIQTGRFRDALSVATMERCVADASLQMARFRGFAAQELENFPAAVEAYKMVVDRFPDDAGTWNNLGNAQAGLGEDAAAIESLEAARRLDPLSPVTRINLSRSLYNAGRGMDAFDVLKQSAADFPGDHMSQFELGRMAGMAGDVPLAIDALETANRLNPVHADTLVKLAQQRAVAWNLDAALDAYERALTLEPANPEAHIGRALNYEHDNKADQLDNLLGKARATGVDPAAASVLEAMTHRRAKRWAEGLAAAEASSDKYDPIRRAQMIGEFNDRLDRPAEAFGAFTEMNRLAAEAPHGPMALADHYRDTVRANLSLLSPDWLESWTPAHPPQAEERPSPVFLFGFPRSGTTLLDTMLMGHPRVRVLEEKQALPDVERSIGDMANLAAMDAVAIREARDRYWRSVDELTDLRDDALLVDKSPLYLNKLPYIWRLFPDAKFVLALRHPMDVVLSCFITNFRPNAAMANFLTLERTAELYDLSFTSFEKAHDLLSLPVFPVVYERMVEDQRAELKPLFDWLGLDWTEDMADHQATAAKRGVITTASYSQVHEPIYRRASGRWTRYREQLAPVEAVVRPWVDQLGYSLDDPAQVPPRGDGQ